jgi:carbamoyltransferase
MGMASYGNPTVDMDWLLSVGSGSYTLNENFVQRVSGNTPNPSKQEPFYSDALVEKVGWRRLPGEPYAQKHFDFAQSAQCQLNYAAEELVRSLHKETGSRRLCIAGGVGLNCVMNQRLLELDVVDEVFVQPAASDAGTALGAAYLVAAEEGEKIEPFMSAHLGNSFSDDEVRTQLDILGAPYKQIDNPAEAAAERIAAGKIVSWFQGRHEYGPRALGARSILADPRRDKMKDLINTRVKFREEFRPFAPSCLASAAEKFFVTCGQAHPYMTITNDVHDNVRDQIPAVVHVDGTSRVQTVDAARAGIYADLMVEVGSRTGIPMVVNTSFNVKGDPVVNTPTQAVATLYGSGMDSLVIGGFVIDKRA